MKASEYTILRFLGGTDKRFIIPVYQRPYSWKREQCVQLLKDLGDVCDYDYQSHFFGSIVFVSKHNGSCEEFIIIDGQQRLTTVSLLLLAIRNYVKCHEDEEIKINPEKLASYLTDEFADDEKKLKLKLVQGDDDAYNKLIHSNDPVADTCITANYDYFYAELGKMTPQQIVKLNDAITKLDIVSISLEPQTGDDPQLIFESMNSTGKDLEPSDKIRNYVLMRMSAKEQEIFYRKYWEPLENIVSRNSIDKLFRYYLNIKLRRSVAEKKLYIEFKNFRESSDESIESIISDIIIYAKFFDEVCNPEDNKSEYADVLSRINKLEVNTCIPLILDVFRANSDGKITNTEVRNAMEIIENYIVRREICNLETNQLNKVFIALGAEIERDIEDANIVYFDAFKKEILKRTGKSRFPNNHDFSDKFSAYELYNAKSSMRKYILERLENFDTKERVAVEEQLADGTLTIEHVMPQTLTPEWKKSLGEKWELIHSKYKDTIGNLTLTAYNSDYSNSLFEKKKTLPDKGFIYSKLSLNSCIKECTEWGEKQIQERARLLYGVAEKIWWIPESNNINTDVAEWIDWDEEYDFTDKVITLVSIMGTVIKVSTITDAYKKINAALYDIEPTIYHKSKFSWFKENKNDLAKAYKIGKSAYIETNRNSQQKMDYVKAVAQALELSSEDLRFMTSWKKTVFDIANESTYDSVTVGKMAFDFFKDALENEKISEEVVELFKTKEYTKKLFSKTDYPILADSRDANRGNSEVLRYRKEPVTYKGKKIFVTFQWFDDNRQDIIKWYKSL